MRNTEAYILQFDGSQKDIMLYFHTLLTEELNLQDKIRFKIPFYYGRSWICYLNPTKDNKVEFAFTRGNELSNAQGLLESKGRKQVYSITFETLKDVPKEVVYEVLQEAILLDEVKPYASKRKKV